MENTNKANIFAENFETIKTMFSKSKRIDTIDGMAKCFINTCPTKKMKVLYDIYKKQKDVDGRTNYFQKMSKEYLSFMKTHRGGIVEIPKTEKKSGWFPFFKTSPKTLPLNEIELTYKWLCDKMGDFHKIDLDSPTSLLFGMVQSGKTQYIFGVVLMRVISGKPAIIIGRNSIKDAVHMDLKLKRFSKEHQCYMKKIGVKEPFLFQSVYAGDMSLSKNGEDGFIVSGDEEVAEAVGGSHKKVIIALNNGTQLTAVNKVLDRFNIYGNGGLTTVLDEADATGYAVVKEAPRPDLHAAFSMVELKMRSSQIVEVSATIWDIMVGNTNLTNKNIVRIRPCENYKGTLSVRYVDLEDKITNDLSLPVPEQDPNFDKIFGGLSITPFFGEDFGVAGGHPVIPIHKTFVQIEHINQHFDYMKDSAKYNKIWTVIKEHSEELALYSNCLRSETITIREEDDSVICNVSEKVKGSGVFEFPKKVVIPHILQWLKDNGGVNKFSHIFIKSGKFADRCRSYVSTDGQWHLTHEYTGDYKTLPGGLQGQRLLHNRPDASPLTYYATKKTNKNILKGYKQQEEQVERLLMEQVTVYASKRVGEEKWAKDKVPSFKLCCESTTNSVFKIAKDNRVKGEDGGPVTVKEYKEELKKVISLADLTEHIRKKFAGKKNANQFKEGQKPEEKRYQLSGDFVEVVDKVVLSKLVAWMNSSKSIVGTIARFLYENPEPVSFSELKSAIDYNGTDASFGSSMKNGSKGGQNGIIWYINDGKYIFNEKIRKYIK
jgi:hypothetical protein